MSFRRLKDLPLRLAGKPHEIDFEPLRLLAGTGLSVLDVGANRGQSIESFKAVLNSPRIHAFEPNPILASALRRLYPDITVQATGLVLFVTAVVSHYGLSHSRYKRALRKQGQLDETDV